MLDIQPQEQRGGTADEKRKTARATIGNGKKEQSGRISVDRHSGNKPVHLYPALYSLKRHHIIYR